MKLTQDKKRVRFSSVTERDYPMILGDNPSVSHGPAVTIDWEHCKEVTSSLDNYERANPLPRRRRNQMMIPSIYREHILRSAGHSHLEICKAVSQIDTIRMQRLATIKSLKLAIIQEFREKFEKRLKKRFKKIFVRSKRGDEMRRPVNTSLRRSNRCIGAQVA